MTLRSALADTATWPSKCTEDQKFTTRLSAPTPCLIPKYYTTAHNFNHSLPRLPQRRFWISIALGNSLVMASHATFGHQGGLPYQLKSLLTFILHALRDFLATFSYIKVHCILVQISTRIQYSTLWSTTEFLIFLCFFIPKILFFFSRLKLIPKASSVQYFYAQCCGILQRNFSSVGKLGCPSDEFGSSIDDFDIILLMKGYQRTCQASTRWKTSQTASGILLRVIAFVLRNLWTLGFLNMPKQWQRAPDHADTHHQHFKGISHLALA